MDNLYETVNGFFLATSIVLTLTLLLVWAIPSGPKCPDCETHLTEEFKLLALRKSNNQQVILKWISCYRCKKMYNRSIDDKSVNNFNELEEENAKEV